MIKMSAQWTGGMRFVHTSATGHGLITDAPVEVGGTGTAATPMELLLLGLIGCTGVDVANILKRMRQPLDALEVTCEAERADDHPKVYTKIHMTYHVRGDIKPEKLERAIEMSEATFCSASAMLGKTAEITSEYVLNG